jgi:hypothetical protein
MMKRVMAAVASLGVVAAISGVTTAGADEAVPRPLTRQEFGRFVALPLSGTGGAFNEAQYKRPPNPICTQTWSDGDVHRTDCEGNAPDNETSIAIDPSDPDTVLAAGNDYQLKPSGGGTFNETALTRAMVSHDGGETWVSHPIPYVSYYATGDPAVTIDAGGTMYVATLGFVWSQGGPTGTNPEILVSHSTDGGTHWSSPSIIAYGSGSFFSPGVSNDKEMVTSWGDGNAIVTWSRFLQGTQGSYRESPIYASVTHNGGASWSTPTRISGSGAFCEGSGPAAGTTQCNQDQGSWPVVAADGSIYVYFFNTEPGSPDSDDQILVVKVDAATGGRVAGPYRVAGTQDGIDDYPVSVFGDLTLHDSQFRVPSFGNIAADPAEAGHLVATWSSMENSPSVDGNDYPNDVQEPYTTDTDSDVMWSESTDGGVTWSDPAPVGRHTGGDQFFSSAAFLSDGTLVVGMMDRSFDPANDAYAYSLSRWTGSGWSTANVSGPLSDPTMDNRWFTGGYQPPGFPYPTSFIGDYTTVAASGMMARPLWTDLRNDTTFGSRTGHDEQLMTVGVTYP